jgi:hypothetical protein
MWYFAEEKANGEPDLWYRYDGTSGTPTPAFWNDDRRVYRLASSVQDDINWTSDAVESYWSLMEADRDDIQWLAFRYAMAVTGQPQFVGLTETGASGGHAIVAYAVTPHGLWVADPNFPGALREIEWSAKDKRFRPYLSGATAKESNHAYDRPAFFGKTAFLPWSGVADRFAEVEADTIGEGTFPTGTLMIGTTDANGETSWDALVDGATLPGNEVLLAYEPDEPGDVMSATLYADDGRMIAEVMSGVANPVTLGFGINELGVYVAAMGESGAFSAVDWWTLTVTAPAPGETAAPTDAPTTAAPDGGVDCSKPRPKGKIEGLPWDLQCGGGITP